MSGRKPRRARRRAIEWVKNLLIAGLTLSAIFLALRTGLYSVWSSSQGGAAGWLSSLFQRQEAPEPSADPGRPSAAAWPVRMAVRGEEAGRYGVQYDAALTGALYDAFSGLLGEALSSAGTARAVREDVWRGAMERPGVYFDFSCDVPLETLAAWLGNESGPAAQGTARRILLARGEGDAVTLYYSNEGDGMYYACDTAVSYVGHLQDAVNSCVPNGAAFVFEYGDGSGYEGLDPYVMVLPAPPAPRVFRGSTPVDLADGGFLSALQAACSFSARTSSSYPVRGMVRIRDGGDVLSVREDGEVTFTAGDKLPRYPVEADKADLIEACRRLAQATVGSWCGEAQVTLTSVTEEDGGWNVAFGYMLDGVPVQLYGEGYAAAFQIRDGQIGSFTLRFRRYEDAEEQSLVLRELQAAAALNALSPAGRELVLCYEDSGADTVQAGWVAQ